MSAPSPLSVTVQSALQPAVTVERGALVRLTPAGAPLQFIDQLRRLGAVVVGRFQQPGPRLCVDAGPDQKALRYQSVIDGPKNCLVSFHPRLIAEAFVDVIRTAEANVR